MRTVPANLQTHLNGEELTLAQCVKVTRADSTVLGFTTGNLDIVFDGVTYSALSSLGASEQQNQVGSGVDNMETVGILSSDVITDTDLLAGKYDGAAIEVFVVNWANLTQGRVLLFSGWIGNVQLTDGQFTAEIRSKSQKLSQQIGQLTCPTCRVVRFGDSHCNVASLASYQFAKVVTAVADNRNITFGSDAAATGYYNYGVVTFDNDASGGLNAGLSREIKVHTLVSGEAVLELQEAFPFDVAVDDEATLEAGCDRLLATCRDKFSNVANFRGEPHIPGNDRLMQRGRQA
jgi:uncharacterized phage protein (TIGR02218 family)